VPTDLGIPTCSLLNDAVANNGDHTTYNDGMTVSNELRRIMGRYCGKP
jgi:hypothetical protein